MLGYLLKSQCFKIFFAYYPVQLFFCIFVFYDPMKRLNKLAGMPRLYLIVLRGLSILAKFLFTTLFFKYSEVDFGAYSLMATTLVLFVFVLGMDFYSYANRAILAQGSQVVKILFNQFSLYFILYVIFFPLIYYIYKLEHFNPAFFYLFYLVLISEHLNYELYRLFFVFKKPLAANINLFLRNGFWVLLAAIYLFWHNAINLSLIYQLWLGGNMVALIFSLILVFNQADSLNKDHLVWDKKWIAKGLYVSLPFLLGSLAYKTIEFSDRYLIDYFLDKKALGVYAFFANMANVLNIVLFTLVVSVLYPPLVESIMKKQIGKFKIIYRQFKKELFYLALAGGAGLAVLLPLILKYIGKEQYLDQYVVFLLLLAGNIILNFSFLFHFVIYAYRRDWKIFKATAYGAGINVVLNIFLIPLWGIAGAAVATLVSFLLVTLVKYKDAHKLLQSYSL